MILIISTCKEKLHENEFVKPVEKILKEEKIKFGTVHYLDLKKKDLDLAKKVIICGTSLQDDSFLKNLKKFSWIKTLNKPILGICSGMQIILLEFGGKLNKKTEIGYYFEFFKRPFLSLEDKHEVYHLHNNYVSLPKEFFSYTTSRIPQAVMHKEKEIYGVLFHPEVRNRKLIEEFVKI